MEKHEIGIQQAVQQYEIGIPQTIQQIQIGKIFLYHRTDSIYQVRPNKMWADG